MNKKPGSIFGGTMIVAGTCIGAGALGLPVLSGPGGFIPAAIFFLVSAIVMACTGLLYLEVCLWMDEDANILSMARRFLGRPGQVIAWFVYLYLFYSLTVAYIAGSGGVVAALFEQEIPRWGFVLIFVGVFAPLVFLGPRAVDKANVILVVGLGLAYVGFVALALPHVKPALHQHADWGKAWIALPVILVSFGYQGILPTLTTYMNRDPARVRAAILLGTALPFIGYMVWEWLILGIVPDEKLSEALAAGETGVAPLRGILKTPWVHLIGEFFAFFALASSFLGVTLGMRDFLADGFHMKKDRKGRLLLCLIVFVPALLLALFDPRLFLLALRYGGGLGGVLLLGVLPILLVWVGRYRHRLPSTFRMKGGRLALLALGLFVLFVLVSDLIVF